MTFLNKKYVQRKNQIIDSPNSLDKKNVKRKKILNYLITGFNEIYKKKFLYYRKSFVDHTTDTKEKIF